MVFATSNRFMTAVCIAIACAAPMTAVSQAQPPAAGQAPLAPARVMNDTNFDRNQPIKAGFVISVALRTATGPEVENSGVFPVDGSGAIYMRLVGRIEVGGLTPTAAAARIADVFKAFIKEPSANVAIVSVPKPMVSLGGAVSRTGPVAMDDGSTLADVLAIYGFLETADLSRIRLVRINPVDKKRTETEYDLNRWMRPAAGESPDQTQNPPLQEGDIVFVPSRTPPAVGTVAVEGDVLRPGPIPLRYGVPTRVREAISLAGGLNPTASYVITLRRAGETQSRVLDYNRIEAGDPQHDIEIRSQDSLYIARLPTDQYVTVSGAFPRAGRFPHRYRMTLTEAIGEAGGLQLYAREKEGKIFRPSPAPGGPRQVLSFNYRDIREGRQPDLVLQAGDTVEIQPGGPPRARPDPLTWIPALIGAYVLLRTSQDR